LNDEGLGDFAPIQEARLWDDQVRLDKPHTIPSRTLLSSGNMRVDSSAPSFGVRYAVARS